MPKKKKITKKERKRNKTLDIVSASMSLLVFLYVIIMEFTNYHVKMSYIPIEVLFLIIMISDYLIIKKSVRTGLNSIILILNSVIMAYILCIEIILAPLTFKNPNSAYIYKQIYTFMISYENMIVPILIVVGGAFVFPGFKEIAKNNIKPIYIVLLTIGIILLAFGLLYSKVCILINGYM